MESNSYSNQISKFNSQEEGSSLSRVSRKLRKKNYEKLNDEIRKKIIFEVTVLGNKLKDIWERLNINVSSAKNILAIYKKEGRIEKKKYRVKRRYDTDKWEDTDLFSNSFSMKNNNLLMSCLAAYSAWGNTQSYRETNYQSWISSNDLCLSYLLKNYWLWDSYSQTSYSNTIKPIEEFWKNSSQYGNNYERF